MKKRVCLLVTLLAIVIMGFAMSVEAAEATEAAEIIDQGYCGGEGDGTNLTWTFYSDGVLVIEGQGKMKDWTEKERFANPINPYYHPIDWQKYHEDINYIIIQDGVMNIGAYAFCLINLSNSLSSIVLPESITSIGNYAFASCSGLNSIVLPESITSIGNGAFASCSGLSSIVLPESITSIGNGAFNSCSSLSSIVLPESITSIGNGAFGSCSSLSSIVLPESITSIGNGAFISCSSLSSIVLPESITSIGDSAFEGCSSLSSINLPESLTIIEDETFANCYSLSSIVIPESITSIGVRAFHCCYRLGSINLPESITSIKRSAFYGCRGFSSIIIPESITNIEDETFSFCSNLSSIKLPESLTRIGKRAFQYCSNLSSIKLPESLMSVEDYAFVYCSSLSSINLPESVTSIGEWAFSHCTSLSSINLPESVTSIGGSAFGSCSSLSNINLPESLTSIGRATFGGCSSLISIKLPESLTSIGRAAFSGCSSLSSIKLPESLASIGIEAFSGCSILGSIKLPESLASIDQEVFLCCSSLSNIYIPSNVKKIYQNAFWGTALTDIYYGGTEEQWKKIKIDNTKENKNGYYDPFPNATVHYPGIPEPIPSEPPSPDRYMGDAVSYNKDLASVAANLSLKAYNDVASDESVKNYLINDLEFGDGSKFHTGSYGGTLAYTLAIRKYYGTDADDNTDILVITAQGSPNPYEMIPEAVSKPDYDNKKAFGGHVPYGIVEEYYNAIVKDLPKVVESGKNYKVLVTGHGLAGAAANLVAANLSDGRIKGVNTERADVFCYTFGALRSLDENAVIKGDYENIHNVYNLYDTFSPLQYGVREGFGMFGQMHLFVRDNRTPEQRNQGNDESIFRYVYRQIFHHVNHDMKKYYRYVEGVKDDQNDLITEESPKHVSIIIGPVDVDVYCDDELVGRVTKNAVDAAANSIDIRVEGDTKIILYPDDSRYEIRISALDEGRMTFGQIDLIGRGVTKVIKDVSLTRGKLFSGTVGGGRTADEFRLYETNKSWKTLSEALSVAQVGGKNIDLVSFYKLMSFAPRLYRNFLKREPDETGLGDWVDALYSGRGTGAKLVSGFVLSKEYQANSLSDEEYVTAMYRIIFKREPDAAGLQSWINVLDNGCTNKKILEGFINSDEFSNLCKELGITQGSYKSDEIADNNYLIAAFVARLYRLCLGRRYERKGLDNWVRALVYRTATGSSVVKSFFNSQEFLNRNLTDEQFVTVLYLTILDRDPDRPGLEYWLEKLRQGYTRNQVLDGFLKSTEFGVLCAEYGITR